MGADNYSTPATVGATISITIKNHAPTWSTAPSNITLCAGSTYNQTDGVGMDVDTGQNLTCSNNGSSCGFSITVSGTGLPVNCNVSFTAPGSANCCYREMVTDNGSPSMTIGATVCITSAACGGNWTGTSVSNAVGGIRGGTYGSVPRVQNNYPADWGKVTLNFDGALSAPCGATVTCGGSGVAITTSYSGSNCTLTAVVGYWTSNSTCVISNVTSTPTCFNCTGLTDTFNTSLRLSECGPRGGTCGGFIDDGTYGSGNTLDVRVIDFMQYSGALLTPPSTIGNYVYVLVEQPNQSPVVRIESFDGDRDGVVQVSNGSSPALKSDVAKVSAGFKGGTGMCDNTRQERQWCYRYTTWDNMDSRALHIPMEWTLAGGDYQMPSAQIWAYTPISSYSAYVGARPSVNKFPNPTRAGFAFLSLLDQSMAVIDLTDILRNTGDLSTISLCFSSLGYAWGPLKIPGNMNLPDLIRQSWTAACSGSVKMSPAYTTLRVFTNRPNIQRKLIVVGASVNWGGFNMYKQMNISDFPITFTAIGTASLNIPAIGANINLGAIGTNGNWFPGTNNPVAVPFELDYRAPGIGRTVALNENAYPLDQERVRNAGSTPAYLDPNRQRGTAHSGQMYDLHDWVIVLGARTGATGLIPMQMVTTPTIDDSQFTIFQIQNGCTKVFANVRPWSGSTVNSLNATAVLRGLPSTATDSDINWATAEPGLMGMINRGYVEPAVRGNGIYTVTPPLVPGSVSNVQMVGALENVNGVPFGAAVWLPMPEVTSPAHPGYSLPPQTELWSRGWPINRNGQMLRGTAVVGSHNIQKDINGARYFTMSNPQTNGGAPRHADMFILELSDPKHIANPYSDSVRGQPNDLLWKYYGTIGGASSLTVTLPFIMPRRVTLSGVNGIVPDPFEAGNFTNQIMEWTLTEAIFDTGAKGLNAAFSWQDWNINMMFNNTYLTGQEKHQFIWQ